MVTVIAAEREITWNYHLSTLCLKKSSHL